MQTEQQRWIDLDKLRTADWNYKDDDAFMAQRLEQAIREDGQVQNLIVRDMGDGTWEVVNGNHRLQAMRRVGLKKAMCFDLGQIDTEEAEQIAIITNETNHDANDIELATRLAELDRVMPQAAMPFTDEQRQGIAALKGFSWEGYKPTPKPKAAQPKTTQARGESDILLKIPLNKHHQASLRAAKRKLESPASSEEFLDRLLTRAFGM